MYGLMLNTWGHQMTLEIEKKKKRRRRRNEKKKKKKRSLKI